MTWLAAAAIALVVGLVTMRTRLAGRGSRGAARRLEALASAWQRRSSRRGAHGRLVASRRLEPDADGVAALYGTGVLTAAHSALRQCASWE